MDQTKVKLRQMLRLLEEALPLAEAADRKNISDDTGINTLSKEIRGVLDQSEAIKEEARELSEENAKLKESLRHCREAAKDSYDASMRRGQS